MIVLYDDACARTFEPFATTRPLGEIRAGALLTRERWSLVLAQPALGFISASHLDHFTEFDAPVAMDRAVPAGAWIVNTRALPVPALLETLALPAPHVIMLDGRVAAVRVAGAVVDSDLATLADGTGSLDALVPSDAPVTQVEGCWLHEVWDIIHHLSAQLTADIPLLAAHLGVDVLTTVTTPSGLLIKGNERVYLEIGAQVEPQSMFDTTAGPIFIRRGTTVQAFTRINGPCYVGQDTMVTTDRVANCSIGDVCRVHGELSTSVLIGHANKGHDGFVGHSILGRWVNLGAGTITSNLKNSYGTVAMWTPTGVRNTGLQFAGTFFGDHAKTGIGLQLTTGCIIGAGANVMDTMPPKAVAPFAWGNHAPYDLFVPDRFIETATRVMARRDVTLDERARRHFETVMAHAQANTSWPR